MNKIFKVIWNVSIQQLVVTSELTKSKGKTSSTDKRVKLSKVAAALAVASGMLTATHTIAATPIDQEAGVIEAWGGNVNDNTPSIDGSMSLGRKSYVDNSNSVAVGNNARIEALPENSVELQGNRISPGSNSVALGSNALVRGQQGTAIGNAAEAVMLSTATGQNAKAKGYASVATGQDAQSLQPWTTSTGVQSLANGKYANALGGQAKANSWGSTALGTKTVVTGDEGTALGYEADVTGRDGTAAGSQSLAAEKATASGAQAKAEGTRATASGFQANASASSAVAIGDNSKAIANNAIAVGVNASARGESAVAVGRNTTATQAGASSLGNEADATAKFATALGHESIANVEGAVALGSQSKTGETVDTASKQITTFTYKFAGGDAYSTVSVGNDNIKRTITNVAAGRLESNSTDAINGSQLYTVAEQLGSEIENIYFHTNTGVAGQGAGDSASNKGRITDKAGATGNFGVTAGVEAKALNENTIAIGHNANSGLDKTVDGKILARGPGSIAIGANTLAESSGTIAIGKDAVARAVFMPQHFTASESIAMGENATVVSLESIAIGGNSWAGTDQANRDTGETQDTKANEKINNVVVGHRAKAISGDGTAIGHNASVTAGHSIAIGKNANTTGSEAVSLGNGAQALASHTTVLGRLASAADTASSSIALGAYAQSQGVGSASVGTRSLSTGRSSTALGHGTTAFGENSTSLGRHAATISGSTTSVGHLSIAAGANGVALGANASAGISGGTSKIVNDLRNTLFSAEAGLRGAAGDLARGKIDQATYNEAVAKRDAAKKALEDKVTEINTAAKADSVAIGTNSVSSGERAIAMGTDAQALGEQSISIGTGNIVKANNAGAFGDPSYVSGDGSYSIGNNNTITTRDTFVLGSGINRADDLTSNLSGTVENSVYLGKDSEATAGSGSVSADGVGTLKALTSEQVAGLTSTAGATGAVTNAKVNNITYSNFAGAKAIGAVTVGASGTERRIQNVAAGEISSTSTDAINGSQLYMVANEIGKGFNVTNNNGVTIGNIKPGDAVQFIDGTNTKANVSTTNTGQVQVKFDAKDTSANVTVKPGSENYVSVATGETTKVGDADVTNYQVGLTQTAIDQIKKEESVKAGSTLVTVTDTAKNSTGGTEFVVDVKKGEFNTITENGKLAPTQVDGVATVSSVINAVNKGYWTANVDGTTKVADVKFGDQVNFADGIATDAVKKADGTIAYDVKFDNNTINLTTDGKLQVNTSALPQAIESVVIDDTVAGNLVTVTPESGNTGDANQTYKVGVSTKAVQDVAQDAINVVGDNQAISVVKTDVNGVDTYTVNYNGTEAAKTTPLSYKANGENAQTVNLSEGLDFTNGTKTVATVDSNGKVTFDLNAETQAQIAKEESVSGSELVTVTTNGTNPTGGNDYKVSINKGTFGTTPTTGDDAGKLVTPNTDGVATVGDVVNAVNNSGWQTTLTDGSTEVINPGDAVNYVNGTTTTANVTKDDKGNVNVSYEVNTSTLVGNIVNNNNGTVGVPNDEGSKLVNQTTVVNAINNVSWNLTTSGNAVGTTEEKIKAGSTVTIDGGKNINITQTGNNISIATSDTPVFQNVTIGGTKNGDTLVNPITIETVVNNDNTVTNVISNVTGNLNPTTSGTTLINKDGTTTSDVKPTTNATAPTLEQAIEMNNNVATVGDVLNAGWNLQANGNATDFVRPYDTVNFANGTGTEVNITTDGTLNTVKVNLKTDNSTVKVGDDGNLTVVTGDLTNSTTGNVTLPTGDTTGSSLVNQTTVMNAINNSGFTVKANTDAGEMINPGDVVDFKDGKNIKITRDGANFTVATEDDVTFNNVTANNLTVGPVTINKDGIDAGNTQITNVKAGTNGTDAVNLDQLNNQSTTLTTKGLNFAGNTGAEIHKDLGQTLNIEGTLANDADASSKNVRVDSDGAKLIVKIADNPVFNNITANEVKLGDVVINASTGINAGDKTITNVANGTAPTDAVNVSQLNASKENVKSTDKSVTITEGKTADGAKEFDLSVNTDGNTIVNGPNGLQVSVTPLTNKDDGSVNVPTGNDATKLATAADIANAINKSGFTVKANTETTGELVNPGDTVDFIQGKNIEITRAGTAFTVKTVDAPVFTSVQFGDNGPIIKADASNNINIAKADGSPTKITNVAAGTDNTDAVNVSQLNDTVAANRAVEKVVKDDAVADNLATVEVASGAVGDANQTYKVGVAKADVQKAAQEAINVVGDNAAITVSKNTADGVDTYTVNYNGTEAAKTTPLSYKANGENPQTVNLSEGLDFTNGTTTVATVGPNGEVTFDLNDAAKAQLAKEETVKAGSDLVTVTNTTKNSTGGTEFIVDVKKGVFDGVTDNGALEIPTTDGVVTANDIAKVINKAFWTANVDGNTKVADVKFGDTVNFVDGQGTDAAVKDGAITFNVKTDGNTIKLDNNGNLTVNTDNLPKTQLVDGKNTTVSGTGSDSDPYKVNVQGDLADISSISNDGTTIKLGDNKVDVGGAKITNVAAGEADTDAVNVSQLKEAVAGVGKTVVAAGNHTTVETKVDGNTTTYTVNAEKTTVSAGTSGNVVVTAGEKDASGTTNYTVELAKDLKADTISVGGDENNGPVTIETKDGKNVISNLTTTLPDPTGKDNVTKPNVAEEDKRNAATIGDVLNSGWNLQTNGKPADFVSTYDTVNFANGTGTTVVSETKNGVTTVKVNVDAVKANTVRETVVAADKNIVVTDTAVNKTGGKEFKVGLARDVNVNSITTNTVNVGPVTMSGSTGEDGTNELSVGTEKAPTRITNVAPGVKGTDAVNVNQLKAGLGNVYNNMNKMDKDLRGGIAGAMAAAGLYHATLPGKSMVSAGVGNYRGQNAVAVGYSRLSDNGKLGVKLSINANTRGDTGAAASIGYQW